MSSRAAERSTRCRMDVGMEAQVECANKSESVCVCVGIHRQCVCVCVASPPRRTASEGDSLSRRARKEKHPSQMVAKTTSRPSSSAG